MTHEQAVQNLSVERYLLDEMSELEMQDFEAHFFDCAECAAEVRTGVKMADGVRAAEREGPAQVVPFSAPARVPPRARARLSVYVPIAAAASLALVAGYQAFVIIPELRTGQGAQALTPVVLRSASRGELPEVPVPDRSGFVGLTLDVNLPSAPAEVLYDLTSEAGVRIVGGRVAAPRPGMPLLILIPGGVLSAGRYTVVVRDPSAPEAEAGTYPFVVR
jgi:hypothetical protein